jgi:glycosyltransferase involved in cell wall biosynthesis
MKLIDTFSYMLDHPAERRLEVFAKHVEYMTNQFEQPVYEESRKQRFRTTEDAYFDWIHFGKAEGLFFAEGKHTLLKVILKVKDEPHIIKTWIEYYARAVGYHNIIIADCGSTDPAFLEILKQYEQRILILRYENYYNHLHWVHANLDLFKTVLINCKYIAVIDADEFLFGMQGNSISQRAVCETLQHSSEDVLAGTWFENVTIPDTNEGRCDLRGPLKFSLDETGMKFGTFGGKAIVKSSAVLSVNYVGHNFFKGVVERITPTSFGRIGILHINKFGPSIVKSRSLMHLKTKGVVPKDIDDRDITHFLSDLLSAGRNAPIEALYIRRYLGKNDAFREASKTFTTHIIEGLESEENPLFCEAFSGFDFLALLAEKTQR